MGDQNFSCVGATPKDIFMFKHSSILQTRVKAPSSMRGCGVKMARDILSLDIDSIPWKFTLLVPFTLKTLRGNNIESSHYR
ncbi:MAG TPA: hypothetical protein VKM55_17500 [Candidatus Lokiarchaeia archaeon]|nr:hypothetical protein [Candidatus Lokiarchaeia archaeon]